MESNAFIYKEKTLYAEKRLEEKIHCFCAEKEELKRFVSYVNDLLFSIPDIQNKKGILFVCIGTDRATGDCLGPLLGYKLKEIEEVSIKVIGTLMEPIHAMNMETYLTLIKKDYQDWVIVAVDASVGSPELIGKITVRKEPLKPGIGVGKILGEIGDISIAGIVIDNSSASSLQSTRLSIVMNMVEFLYEGLTEVIALSTKEGNM